MQSVAFVDGHDVVLAFALPFRVVCNDCGYGNTLDAEDIVEMGEREMTCTLGEFAATLYCPDCREQIGPKGGRNLRVEKPFVPRAEAD